MGTNGSIVINAGSILSATTQLKLYADGNNGSITFQGGNITLSTGSLAGIVAAPTITIKTGTVVTINGSEPLQVFTNTANYSSDFGGNDTQTGTFAGTAQPSAAPQPFAASPAYSKVNPSAIQVAANTATAPTTIAPVATNTTKTGSTKTTGLVARPHAVAARPLTIPFSALNPKDLSYDANLLKGAPQTTAAKRNKVGTSLPVAEGTPRREKVRATAERSVPGSNRPVTSLLPDASRLSR